MNRKAVSIILSAAIAIFPSGCASDNGGGSAPEAASQTEAETKPAFSMEGEISECSGSPIDTSAYEQTYLFKIKNEQHNPLLTNIFCADPTSVVYNGRMYVYGTNDNQQYLEKGGSENTYEMIKSLVIMSSEDMVNWRFEGYINTEEIAPWITASWAPSIVSREEEDGLTHFYLYFSNSGGGVGVLTATDPAGPFSDPLGKPLISRSTRGLAKCNIPFDPGVCIDDDGVGWLTFGGGTKRKDSTDFDPDNARIVRLGADMISLDSDISVIHAPYEFEASELNFINGTYVYTYNTNWEKRVDPQAFKLCEVPPICSMCYMTSKTPLDSESWEYKGYYLKNPGELGMEYSNNHTHMEKFGDNYYLFYHTLILQKERGIKNGFRSIGADIVEVDEATLTINKCNASRKGLPQISSFDPYKANQAEDCFSTDCEYVCEDGVIYTKKGSEGNITVTVVKGADFGSGSAFFGARAKGSGSLEIRLDSLDGQSVCSMAADASDWTVCKAAAAVSGEHDIFIIASGDIALDEWQFIK